MTALENIAPTTVCEIDHELFNILFKTDHHLDFTSFDLHLLNIFPTQPTTIQFLYNRIAQIPLRKKYPKNANDPPP